MTLLGGILSDLQFGGIKRGHLEEAGRWVVSFDFLEMKNIQVLTHAPWLHSSRKHLVKNEARQSAMSRSNREFLFFFEFFGHEIMQPSTPYHPCMVYLPTFNHKKSTKCR